MLYFERVAAHYGNRWTSEATETEAAEALFRFVGQAQISCIKRGLRGEEQEYFQDIVRDLLERFRTMPRTGETNGRGRDAVAHLHYFRGGADWYITEADAGSADDPESERGKQHQAFGLADLFGDGGELGYISIEELIRNDVELDFHWTPKPLKECKR